MALYDTAANIISDVAVEVGLGAVSDAFASTDANVAQLRSLLKSTGRAMVLRHAWLQQRKEYSFTTSGSGTYSLPADFQRMVDQSGWNRTNRRPLQPASPQEWQYLKAALGGTVYSVLFRPHDSTLELWPQPDPSGETVAFEYMSRYWVQSSGATSPDKDAPTANGDTVKLDVQLATRALKLAFLRAKGFDTTAAQQEFEEAFDSVASANAGAAPVLSLAGPPLAEKLLDMTNAPATGFGLDGDGGLF